MGVVVRHLSLRIVLGGRTQQNKQGKSGSRGIGQGNKDMRGYFVQLTNMLHTTAAGKSLNTAKACWHAS